MMRSLACRPDRQLKVLAQRILRAVLGHRHAPQHIAALPIEIRHAERLAAMAFHHRDPFDRLVIAQALVEELHLVSADQRFDPYGVSRVW